MKDKLKKWMIDTGIRTIKTMAETALGGITAATVLGGVDWMFVLSSSVLAGIACILMNIERLPVGDVNANVEQE